MLGSLPDYLLVAELLGFGTGGVLSILLALLVRRSPHNSPGTRLLVFCALLWNIAGLAMFVFILSGVTSRSLAIGLAETAQLSAGALFPTSFLLLWSRPFPAGSWKTKVNTALLWAAAVNAVWLIALLFLCIMLPRLGLHRVAMYAVPLNASFLLTIGAVTQAKGRFSAAGDRIYLALTLIGIWACTTAIFVLDNVRFLSPRWTPLLVIVKAQSPFLAVVGALFFFARFRSSDVLIKHSLRVVAAVCVAAWTCFFILETLPGLAILRDSAFPQAMRAGLAAATIAALLLLFSLADRAIERTVDCWILRQPDYRATLAQLWEQMARADTETELFAIPERIVAQALDVSVVRVLRRDEVPAVERHAAANAGQLWELACDDACRRILGAPEVDLLAPVRVHGEITHVIAVAPGPFRRSLVTGDLAFLQTVAGQIGSRLESLAHERDKLERQTREAHLRHLAAQAELKALRAQINPHFLFNSLNTIADLIVTDPEKAEAMTVLLAKVFRHVLMNSDRQLTRVADEMEFLRTYLHVEEIRFGDRLRVRMELDPAVSADAIPSLILQPVVENAIKHGLAPKVGSGHLSITADRHGDFVRLAVEDDGVGTALADGLPKSNGVGLKLIAERLKTLYNGRASLSVANLSIDGAAARGSRVTILIPRNETAV
jgi:two-component system, LytTR family, sensor kinase